MWRTNWKNSNSIQTGNGAEGPCSFFVTLHKYTKFACYYRSLE
nr:MAG TPA: hypothetical protein [Caudoviricetes sp.]